MQWSRNTIFIAWYRDPVDKLDFTRKNGSEKRTPYTFTRNVYEMFYPIHHKRLCSAIDQLPNPEDFDVESFSRPSDLGPLEQKDSQLTTSYSQQTEQEFPSSQTSEPVFKKPKGKGKKWFQWLRRWTSIVLYVFNPTLEAALILRSEVGGSTTDDVEAIMAWFLDIYHPPPDFVQSLRCEPNM